MQTEHPCFSEGCDKGIKRIHLPVAESCNLGCGFCEFNLKQFNERINTKNAISSEKALNWLEILRKKDGESFSIISIAGPGEPLFSKGTFKTLKKVKKLYPEAKTCLCTNGIELKKRKTEILDLLDYLTITVNVNNAETAKKIYRFVILEGEVKNDIKSFQMMLDRIWEGIKAIGETSSLKAVKVNTIYFPDINEKEIIEIAKKAAKYNIDEFNIKKLINKGYFKNHEKTNQAKLRSIENEASKYIKVFKKCKNCSYDAYGVPGRDKKLNNRFCDY